MRYPREEPPAPENVDAAVSPFHGILETSLISGTLYSGLPVLFIIEVGVLRRYRIVTV